MIELNGISWWLLVLMLLFSLGIYAFFWAVRRYVLPLIKSQRRLRYWQRLLFQLELVAWSGFSLFLVYRLLMQAPVATLLLLAVSLFLSRFWWQDWLPGLLFRLDRDVEPGDYLVYKGQQYRIQHIRARNLKLISSKGIVLILPYRLLEESLMVKATETAFMSTFSFELEYKAPDAAARLERLMSDCPWVVPAHPPRVEALGESRFRITSVAPDQAIQERQQRYVLEKVSDRKG